MLLRHSRQTCALSCWSRIYIAAALLREQKVSQAPRTDTGCCAFRAVASRQDRKLVRHSGQRLAALPPSVSLPLVSLQNRKLVRHTGQRLAAVVSRSSIPPGQKVSQALRPETRCSLSLSLSPTPFGISPRQKVSQALPAGTRCCLLSPWQPFVGDRKLVRHPG